MKKKTKHLNLKKKLKHLNFFFKSLKLNVKTIGGKKHFFVLFLILLHISQFLFDLLSMLIYSTFDSYGTVKLRKNITFWYLEEMNVRLSTDRLNGVGPT